MGSNILKLYKLVPVVLLLLAVLSCVSSEKEQRMQVLLAKAEAMNTGYISMDTVTFMDEVLDFYMSHGTTEEKARANYMMGSVYRDKGDSPMALEYYLKAVSCADTTKSDCNFELMSRVYGQIATLYNLQRYPQKGIEMWNIAKSMAQKANDTIMSLQCTVFSSGAYYILGDRKKALDIMCNVNVEFQKIGATKYAAANTMSLAEYYLEKDSLLQAKGCLDEYISLSGLVDENGEVEAGCESFYYYIGYYYEKANVSDSALYFYKKLATFNDNIMNLEDAYKGLMRVYLRLNRPDSVAKYAELYAEANDSVNVKHSADEINRVRALYDYTFYQQSALENFEKVNRLLEFLGVCGILVITCALVVWYFYKKHKDKYRLDISQQNEKYVRALQDYNKVIIEYDMYKKKRVSYESVLQERVKSLEAVLSTYQDDLDFDKFKQDQALQQHSFVLSMHAHAARGIAVTPLEWNALIDLIEKALPAFLTGLSSTGVNLSNDEIRLCILTRLNFIPSEIAVLMDIKKQRVSNLRKSLNIRLFNNEDIKSFKSNIYRL